MKRLYQKRKLRFKPLRWLRLQQSLRRLRGLAQRRGLQALQALHPLEQLLWQLLGQLRKVYNTPIVLATNARAVAPVAIFAHRAVVTLERKLAIVIFAVLGVAHASLLGFGGDTPQGVVLSGEESFDDVLKLSRGTEVNFYAWGGSAEVNAHIRFIAKQLKKSHDITLRHVKLTDTAQVVAKLLEEKKTTANNGQAGASADGQADGQVDALWINGENFRVLKQAGLLYGPFTQMLPNMARVAQDAPLIEKDFQTPIEGLEAPWGRAQLTFFYDSRIVRQPPNNAAQLAKVAIRNPGKFTYPSPPDFIGTAFLKQLLYETVARSDLPRLIEPVSEKDFTRISRPLFAYLDNLHPYLWREGRAFPSSGAQMQDMLESSELLLTLSYNPVEAQKRKLEGSFKPSIRTFGFERGMIANAHFIAIPKTAANKAGALVFINTLLSIEAQKRKADPRQWGDPTVLDPNALNTAEKKGFVFSKNPFPALLEPHPDWTELLENTWKKRYSR